MRAWVKIPADWIRSSLSRMMPTSIWTKLSSLAGKVGSGLAVPLKALASGVGSLITTFLSGNWVAVIFHPITLTLSAIVLLTGFAYSKGKQHERLAQAKAIVALNNDLAVWRRAYEESDEMAEQRLKLALDNWRKTAGSAAVISTSCKLAPDVATKIADIAGD